MPVHMPVGVRTGPVLVLCWHHRPNTDPVLGHNGMFMGMILRGKVNHSKTLKNDIQK